MPTPDPLTGQIIGKAKIEVRRLSMTCSKEPATLELDVKGIR